MMKHEAHAPLPPPAALNTHAKPTAAMTKMIAARVSRFMSAYMQISGSPRLTELGDVTGRALGVHDHGGIVWDEVAAFLMILPFAPASLAGSALAFFLFRLFDLWKPFPIDWADAQVKGGLGVMLDDVLAAGYAIAVLLVVARWL